MLTNARRRGLRLRVSRPWSSSTRVYPLAATKGSIPLGGPAPRRSFPAAACPAADTDWYAILASEGSLRCRWQGEAEDRQLGGYGIARKQDERAPFVRALRRARMSAYSPGEFVEQESFMGAREIRALAGCSAVITPVSASTIAWA